MIDMFGLYEDFCGRVNTQQGGHTRPDRNFTQWVRSISVSLYEEKFAAWGKSQKIVDDMSKPFLKTANVQVVASGSNYGIAAFPADYGHYSSARYFTRDGKPTTVAGLETYDHCGKKITKDDERPPFIDDATWEAIVSERDAQKDPDKDPTSDLIEVPIDLVSNDRWGATLNHRFMKPTTGKPKMTQYEKGFKVAPVSVSVIVLDYLRVPTEPTFAYTVAPADLLTGQGEYLVYDKTKSIPLDWSPLVKNEILIRLEKMYAKYIREDFIYQTAEADRKLTV